MDEQGLNDAAIMLMSLGEEEAAEVFKHFSPKEVQKLGETIARMRMVDAADTACRQAVPAGAPATGILLRKVDSLNWSGQAVAVWLPVDGLGKPLSGAIIFIEDMPPELQAHFMAWLEQQPLSISRPPLGLPSRGQAYFAEDVLTSMDSVHH